MSNGVSFEETYWQSCGHIQRFSKENSCPNSEREGSLSVLSDYDENSERMSHIMDMIPVYVSDVRFDSEHVAYLFTDRSVWLSMSL